MCMCVIANPKAPERNPHHAVRTGCSQRLCLIGPPNTLQCQQAAGLGIYTEHASQPHFTPCRFIAAAQEVNYAAKVLKVGGEQMEQMRFWQYVVKNGKDTLFSGYAASLDLYVLFCWSQLGGLSGLLTGLLVAEVSPACQDLESQLS